MYGYTMRVAQDVGAYQALHRAVMDLAGDNLNGLILHMAAPTSNGFELTEVWSRRTCRTRSTVTCFPPRCRPPA